MVKNKVAQMKIQQTIFMILGVFLFFILVGLFVLQVQFNNLRSTAQNLNQAEAINSLITLTEMTELSCSSGISSCVDGDKLEVMSKRKDYATVWPFSSLEVYKVYPAFNKTISCPGVGCNYYKVFDNGQTSTEKVSAYVTLCYQRMKELQVYDDCEIAKILVGVKQIN
jgi:hypothetical protein